MDYHKFRTHLLRLIDGLVESFTPLVPAMSEPDAAIVLGGYSWFRQEFEVDVLQYSQSEGRFVNQSIPHGPGWLGKIAWAGDQAKVARASLKELLVRKYSRDVLEKKRDHPARYAWEPLEVIRDMLRDPARADTIGGAPQLAVVAQHLNSAYLGIRWPSDESPVYLRGRPLLPYERVDSVDLSPDSMKINRPR